MYLIGLASCLLLEYGTWLNFWHPVDVRFAGHVRRKDLNPKLVSLNNMYYRNHLGLYLKSTRLIWREDFSNSCPYHLCCQLSKSSLMVFSGYCVSSFWRLKLTYSCLTCSFWLVLFLICETFMCFSIPKLFVLECLLPSYLLFLRIWMIPGSFLPNLLLLPPEFSLNNNDHFDRSSRPKSIAIHPRQRGGRSTEVTSRFWPPDSTSRFWPPDSISRFLPPDSTSRFWPPDLTSRFHLQIPWFRNLLKLH